MSKHRIPQEHTGPDPTTEPTEIPPHRRCIGRTLNGNTLHEESVERQVGYLCQNCYDRLRKTLIALPDVAAWLDANIAAGGSPDGQKVTRSKDDPIPLRLDILDLIGPDADNPAHAMVQDSLAVDKPWLLWAGVQYVTAYRTEAEAVDAVGQLADDDQANGEQRDDGYYTIQRYAVGTSQTGEPSILRTVREWALIVNEEICGEWPASDDLSSMVIYLAQNLHETAGAAWVDEMYAELLDVTHRSQRAAPWKQETRRERGVRCERCDKMTLVVHKSDGIIRCEKGMGGCGYQRAVTEAYARVGDGSKR